MRKCFQCCSGDSSNRGWEKRIMGWDGYDQEKKSEEILLETDLTNAAKINMQTGLNVIWPVLVIKEKRVHF